MSEEKTYDKMRSLRVKCGFTQEQVAKILNLERTSYTKIEKGQTRLSIEVANKLAKLYHVPIIEFLSSETSSTLYANDSGAQQKPANRKKAAKVTENSSHIYDLQRDERMLLAYFRMMSKEEKQAFLDSLESSYKDA